MIISDWFQGQYSNGSYNGSNQYISSGMIRVNNVITSVTRASNTFPIVLKQWRRIDASSDWYENGEVESRQSTATIYFFDRDRNMVGSGLGVDAGETVNIANRELAIYILVTVSVGTDVVNRNIHPKDAEPPEDYPSDTYYQIDTDLEYTFTEETWSIGEDGFPHSNFAELFPKDMTIPIPKAMWRITEGYNNGFPFNELLPNIPIAKGAFENASALAAVRVPISVKTIGATAFKGTALQRVKIAADCTYGEQSFPEGCVVERYDDDRYGQLYDSAGKAVLDYDARRILVLKEVPNNG